MDAGPCVGVIGLAVLGRMPLLAIALEMVHHGAQGCRVLPEALRLLLQ